MIPKKYRLREREVAKVLRKGKPFFSHNIVANFVPNKLPHHRFAIVLGAKNVINNVERNTLRRRYYDITSQYLDEIDQ